MTLSINNYNFNGNSIGSLTSHNYQDINTSSTPSQPQHKPSSSQANDRYNHSILEEAPSEEFEDIQFDNE
jgi:hypothetical protein